MSISFEHQVNKEDVELFSACGNDKIRRAMVNCCVGATIGDALGSPFENKKPDEIKRMWPSKGNGFLFPLKMCNLGLIYTDDTQMSISLIESYLVEGKLNPIYVKSLWKHLSEMKWFEWAGFPLAHYQFGGFRGTGRNFRESVLQLNDTCSNDISKETAGNGVAMRVWPCVCSVFRYPVHERVNRLRIEVLSNANLTHRSPLGIIPAYSIAYLTFKWMSGELMMEKTNEILSHVLNETKQFETYLSQNGYPMAKQGQYSFIMESIIGTLSKLPRSSPDETLPKILQKIQELSQIVTKSKISGPSDGFAVASCTTALLHSVIYRDEDLLKSLKKCIDIGGDTDTVASMVGAMIGAYKGAIGGKIPFYVSQQVVDFKVLYQFYNVFVEWCLGISTISPRKCCGFLIWQERMITEKLLGIPNHERTPHYVSKNHVDVVQGLIDSLKRERQEFGNYSNEEDFIRTIIPKYASRMTFLKEKDISRIFNQVFQTSSIYSKQ